MMSRWLCLRLCLFRSIISVNACHDLKIATMNLSNELKLTGFLTMHDEELMAEVEEEAGVEGDCSLQPLPEMSSISYSGTG